MPVHQSSDGDTFADLAGTGNRLVQADTAGKVSASLLVLGASATWDPANMAADGDVVSTTIAVTGAATTGRAIASLSSIGTNNVMVSAHVQAADTVRVMLMNKSGGALDLTSGTLTVTVLQ